MILEVTTPLTIPKILEMARKMPHLPVKALEDMLIRGMASEKSKILVDDKEGVLRGFMYASIEHFDGQPVVFIQASYIKSDLDGAKYIGHEFISRMRAWAKESQIEYLYMMTPRNPKGYTRKYKFEFYTYVMRRRVNDEKTT